MLYDVLIWCDCGPDIGMGHFSRSHSLYQCLRNSKRLNVKFLVSEFPDKSYRPDVIIFDGVEIPGELQFFLSKTPKKILLSPVCSNYTCFDFYVGRIPPFTETKELQIYIGEISFDNKLEKLRETNGRELDQASVCLSGGNYQQHIIEHITQGLLLTRNFKIIHFPKHYEKLDLPKSNDVSFRFHESSYIWSSDFGNSKFFIGSDGIMIFEALLLNKSIISVTTNKRRQKVNHYKQKRLLKVVTTDEIPEVELSKEIKDQVLDVQFSDNDHNKLWYRSEVVNGQEVVERIIFNGIP